MSITEIFGIKLPRRHNTRRNRLKALRRYLNQYNARLMGQPPHESAPENECRCAAHLADYLDQGGTLKAYSAWTGCSVRYHSKQLDDFRHHRLPGQRRIAAPGS